MRAGPPHGLAFNRLWRTLCGAAALLIQTILSLWLDSEPGRRLEARHVRPCLLIWNSLPLLKLKFILGSLGSARNMHDALPCPLSVLSQSRPSFFADPRRVGLSQSGLTIMM